MNEVWVLEFTGEYCDCLGVFSTKEKAKNALFTHYTEHSYLWKDFECIEEDEYFARYTFKVKGKPFFAYISLYEIDEI